MNEKYCDEVSENLITFVTVDNARKEGKCKQKNSISCSYLVYYLLKTTKLSLKGI